MNETPPSSQEWQALFEAAGEFYKLRPWEWMEDSELFGVLNPETGEIGYCCVMGNLGELLALGVYLGSDGLETYLMMQSGELEEGDDNQEHRITSDFPLARRESSRWRFFSGRRALHTATGRSGSGANRVKITTIGCNVTIRRK